MSNTSAIDPKAWLNAKDNWLGEGPFRPAQDELRRLSHHIGRKEGSRSGPSHQLSDVSGIDASEVYFAHG